jgi:hypothetical protein
MEVNVDDESSQSSHINTEEMIGKPNETKEQEAESDHENGEDEQTEMDIAPHEVIESRA